MDAAVTARRRQALGRGLGALIPGGEGERRLFYCPVDQILPPLEQPRSAINPATLRELTESIKESGVLQPVLLKRQGMKYRLIAGERRWRAAKLAGLAEIPAMVKDVEDDEAFALALIENVQREDLTPMEEALAYRRLLDEHGYTQKQLAEKVGKGRSTIANTLRLLDLPEAVQAQVQRGQLSAGHARAVLAVPQEEREAFTARLLRESATVREAEAESRPRRDEPKAGPSVPHLRPVDPLVEERRANLHRLERRLRESLDTNVRIHDRGGQGRIELFYDDDDILEAILDRLLEKRR
jgi:ParB family transcriptional regulator, chromosome partitioning protein